MGGISKFFGFIKRIYENHYSDVSLFFGNHFLNALSGAASTFAKFVYISFVFYVAYSYINLFFVLIKSLIDFYYFVIDFLNNDLNNVNGVYYNPFLLVFKNVLLPPLMFVLEIVFPIYLFLFKGAIFRALFWAVIALNGIYTNLVENYFINRFGGYLKQKNLNPKKFFPHVSKKWWESD